MGAGSGGAETTAADRHRYRTVAREARAQIEERRSRFLGLVAPAVDERAARAIVDASRKSDPDATHHCWAWRVGAPDPRERSSDDGEPAGTAGEPMTRVLRGASLVEVVAVVTRWYGGVNLGRGGLARAYAAAVAAALEEARVVTRQVAAELEVQIPFERLGAVKAVLGPHASRVVDERWSVSGVRWRVRLPRAELPLLEESLRGLRLEPERPDSGP